MNPVVIRSMLDDLLTVAVDVLTPDPLDPDDPRTAPPEFQTVHHGPGLFSWDCEMVATAVERFQFVTPPLTGGGPPPCAVLPEITVAVTLLRCWPTPQGGDLPTSTEIDAAASVLAVDLAALAGGIADAWADGSLFPTAGIECGRVTLGIVEHRGPSGGLAGWWLPLTVRF